MRLVLSLFVILSMFIIGCGKGNDSAQSNSDHSNDKDLFSLWTLQDGSFIDLRNLSFDYYYPFQIASCRYKALVHGSQSDGTLTFFQGSPSNCLDIFASYKKRNNHLTICDSKDSSDCSTFN